MSQSRRSTSILSTIRPLRARNALSLVLVGFLLAPAYVSADAGPDRGLQELRSLVMSSAGKPAAAELSRIESRYSGSRAAALARFLRGYNYHAARNHAPAIDALDSRLIGASSTLGDLALFFRADSLSAVGRKADAMRDFAALARDYRDSIRAVESSLRSAELAIETGDAQAAIRDLSALAESGDPDALFVTARALETIDARDRAMAIYRRLYYAFPATQAAVKAESRLVELGLSPGQNPDTIERERGRADRLFEAGQWSGAATAYERLKTGFPELSSVDEINLRHGVSLLNNNQPAQAVAPLSRVREDGEHGAEALNRRAEALRRSNRAAEAGVVVDRLLSRHPRSKWSPMALHGLAVAIDRQNSAAATQRFRRLLELYPESEFSAEASYNLGWRAYQSRQYAEAARLLDLHLANHRSPVSRWMGEAGFWSARASERLGNNSRALALYDLVVQRYPFGYHGYVASRRAKSLRSSNPRLTPEAPRPGSDLERIRDNILFVVRVNSAEPEGGPSKIAKADDLELIGLTDLAIRELNSALEVSATSPKLNLRLAQLYSRRGDPFQATLVLRRSYPDLFSYSDDELPREAWEIFFPLKHWDTIKQEAGRYGIDPFIAAGLIRQESVFNPNAISRVGARGLMQLMPETGRMVARRQGAGAISTADLYNPQLNIRLGMNYLAQMIGQFRRIEYAAAAYNAGPGRAQRWIAERGSLDIEDWIETIPFAETRGYVQGVLRNSENYRRLYRE